MSEAEKDRIFLLEELLGKYLPAFCCVTLFDLDYHGDCSDSLQLQCNQIMASETGGQVLISKRVVSFEYRWWVCH